MKLGQSYKHMRTESIFTVIKEISPTCVRLFCENGCWSADYDLDLKCLHNFREGYSGFKRSNMKAHWNVHFEEI